MKKLITLPDKEILSYVMSSKELRSKFEEYVSESEMNWIGEKTDCFRGGAADWSLGAYSYNYFDVKNYDKFVDGVSESIRCFGGTEQLEKRLNQCKHLWGTNLYEYMVGKLCEMYYEQELKPIIDWIEKVSMHIYNEEANDDLLDYLDCFADCYLDDIYLNDKNQMIRREVIA